MDMEFMNPTVHCSFCGRSRDEVDKLVSGPSGVYICDECIEACNEMLKEHEMGEQDDSIDLTNLPPMRSSTSSRSMSSVRTTPSAP